MRKLGNDLTAKLVEAIRDTQTTVEYGSNYIRVRNVATQPYGFTCTLKGYVWVPGMWGLHFPFDWEQRRSIARAVRWRHKREQERLIRLGVQAAREGQK